MITKDIRPRHGETERLIGTIRSVDLSLLPPHLLKETSGST